MMVFINSTMLHKAACLFAFSILTVLLFVPCTAPAQQSYNKLIAAGAAELQKGEYGAARSAFEEAVRLKGDDPAGRFGLGLAYFHLREDRLAEQELSRVIELNPRETTAFQVLGELSYRNDDLERAAGYWEKAVELNPGDEKLRARLDRIRKEHRAEKDFNRDVTSHFLVKYEGREKIAAGALGDIQQITAYYANGLLNNGTHIADALQFLLDDKAAWASGIHNTQNTAAPFGGKNVDGLVGFSKGAVAALQSLDSGSFGIHELRMLGKKGALFIGQNGLRFEWVPVRDGVTFAGVRELDWEGAEAHYDDRSMLACTLVHVIDCLDGAAAPESTLQGGYHTMQILDALLRSAEQSGQKISI